VLLTITPRVVRGWDMPNRTTREFYSGTENTYSDKPLFASLETSASAEIRTNTNSAAATQAPAPIAAPITAQPVSPPAAAQTPVNVAAIAAPASSPTTPAILTFSEPVYEYATGQDFEIKLIGSNLGGATNVPIEILYNPQLLSFVKGVKGDAKTDAFNVSADPAKGSITVSLNLASNSTNNGNLVLANVTLRGTKPGVSYLVYRTPSLKTAAGENVGAQVRASRIVLK
jgi:general secretion pathway protein D